MEYRYSDPVNFDPSSPWVCDLIGKLPVRAHRDNELADRGCLRAQRDWKQLFGDFPPGFTGGGMGLKFNSVALCVPEALPDRIEHVAYFFELFNLVDDAIDHAESPVQVIAPFAADAWRTLECIKSNKDLVRNGQEHGLTFEEILCNFVRAVIDLDPEGAEMILREIENWMLALMKDKTRSEAPDLDEYLDSRIIDGGLLYVPHL